VSCEFLVGSGVKNDALEMVSKDRVEFVKLLVEYLHYVCSFLNSSDDCQPSPLIYGCCENDKECNLYLVDILLKYNVSAINTVAFSGKALLWKAAFIGHKNVVEGLLTLPTVDRNIGAEDFAFRRRALHAAAYPGHFEIVDMLISAGSDVAKSDTNGSTSLMRRYQGWAAGDFAGSEDTLEFLIDYGLRRARGTVCVKLAVSAKI
jgi:hypothetical protein